MAVNRLFRFAFSRPHLFLAAVPGGLGARLAVERYARSHGWPLAASPADADLLVVCGTPTDWLAEAVEVVWGQIPSPRARVDLTGMEQVAPALENAQRQLADPASSVTAEHAGSDASAHHDHGDHAASGLEQHTGDSHAMHEQHAGPAEHDTHGGHDTDSGHDTHGGHDAHGGHHGHGGMVAGLPMADRGPDRDGLNLDQVRVALGPFLPAWPIGLRLRLTLQGDVAGQVAVDHVPSVRADELTFAGLPQRLDALANLLEVVGDDGMTARARRLRDELRDGSDIELQLTKFAARLRRSRLLRAATDGVATVDGQDATDRWQGWLDAAQRSPAGEDLAPMTPPVTIDQLPQVLAGLELGGLRIAVASLIPPAGIPASATAEHHAHG